MIVPNQVFMFIGYIFLFLFLVSFVCTIVKYSYEYDTRKLRLSLVTTITSITLGFVCILAAYYFGEYVPRETMGNVCTCLRAN